MVLYIDEKFSQYEITFRNSFAEFRIKSYQARMSPFAIFSHHISIALNCKLHYAERGCNEGSYVYFCSRWIGYVKSFDYLCT